MRILITARELMDRDWWADFCLSTGRNPYAVREGMISLDHEIEITLEQLRELGFYFNL